MALAEPAWQRRDVSAWTVLQVEKAATSVATWLEEPETRRRWLHKDTVIPANGIEQGEDWSEVASTAVAKKLGIPCADTRLCRRNGRRGSLSGDVNMEGHSLYNGYVVLEECPSVLDYFPHIEGDPGFDPDRPMVKRPGHRLDNIKEALAGARAPASFTGPDSLDAFDVFVGYLLFDALVANRDRHEQNWAVLTPGLTSLPVLLAPSYDHASSLGYNLTDERRRIELARQGGIASWAAGGTAWRFEHTGSPRTAQSLVELFASGLDLASSEAAAHWTQQVRDLNLQPVLEDLSSGAVPEMSVDASTFACELLVHNLERLKDAI
jgi:hypothetical protein